MADIGEALLADSRIKRLVLRGATADMIALIDDATLAVESGWQADACRGLTLWWEVKSDWRTYKSAYPEVAFAIDMKWYTFLDAYNS